MEQRLHIPEGNQILETHNEMGSRPEGETLSNFLARKQKRQELPATLDTIIHSTTFMRT